MEERPAGEDEEVPVSETGPGGVLLLPGRKFPFSWSSGAFTVLGAPVYVFEEENAGLGTGLTVWDGALVLGGYCEAHLAHDLRGKVVVEVGSGTGLVGLTAAVLGADAYLTDLPYCMDNLERVIAANTAAVAGGRGHVTAVPLDWHAPGDVKGLPGTPPDFILGADVVWVPELIEPLVRTLTALSGPATVTLLAHQTRAHASDAELLRRLTDAGFRVDTVPRARHHPRWQDQAISILEVTRAQ